MVWHTDVKPTKVMPKKKNSLFRKPQRLEQNESGESKKFKDLMRAYWQKYCEKSTIHGVRYIYDPTLRGIER